MGLPKLYIGPMSANIIDAVIEYSNEYNVPLGLVASRRQIEFNGGYVGPTTSELCAYVHARSSGVLCVRDHGGPLQGSEPDDGFDSLEEDSTHMDMVHLDPWKAESELAGAIEMTSRYLMFCSSFSDDITFEIGTEQTIKELSVGELDQFLSGVKVIIGELFSRVKYAVIQSGTSLQSGSNTGTYNEDRLLGMVEVCKSHGVFSKEHNGDYLDPQLVHRKFELGLDAINIAPEFGTLESRCILKTIQESKPELLERLFLICLASPHWEKWVEEDFVPEENKVKLIEICGHYMYNNKVFLGIKRELRNTQELDAHIKQCVKGRIHSILGG